VVNLPRKKLKPLAEAVRKKTCVPGFFSLGHTQSVNYRFLTRVATTNKANPAMASQKAYGDKAEIVLKKPRSASTPRITATHHVITFGALSLNFIFNSPYNSFFDLGHKFVSKMERLIDVQKINQP
jgi:hypothetical protein